MNLWNEKHILILGSTYPSYSMKYQELSCTGGILDESFELIRLHPIPRRYLDENFRFKAFQWINAKITKHNSDPRPESFRINPDTIKVDSIIPPKHSEIRRKYIVNSPHFISSVNELKYLQKNKGTSMGIISPKKILDCIIEKRPESERNEWIKREKILLSQPDLFLGDPKPIDFPYLRLKIRWQCDDSKCQGHEMGLNEWGINELCRKLINDPDRDNKILNKMQSYLDQSKYDVFLFLGSFRDIQYNFGLMASYSAPKIAQKRLF